MIRKHFVACRIIIIALVLGLYGCDSNKSSTNGDTQSGIFEDSLVWSTELEDSIVTTPIISNEKVFVRTKHKLIALDISTGKLLWDIQTPLPGKSDDSPISIHNDLIIVPTGSENEYGVMAVTQAGEVLWDNTENIEPFNGLVSPVISFDSKDMTLFVARQNSALSAFSLDSGLELWFQPILCRCNAKVHVWNDLIIIINGEEDKAGMDIVALAQSTGDEVWRIDINSNIPRTLLYADTLYVIVDDIKTEVWAIDLHTLETIWQYTIPEEDENTYLYLGYNNETLYLTGNSISVLDAELGTLDWVQRNPKIEYFRPVLGDDLIFIRDTNQYLQAIDTISGEQVGALKIYANSPIGREAEINSAYGDGLLIVPAAPLLIKAFQF